MLDVDPIPTDDVLSTLRFDDAARQTVEAMLRREIGCETLPLLILLNANCSDLMPLRLWPPGRYVELARCLTAAFDDVWICFTGAPEDIIGIGAFLRGAGLERCINLVGKTSMRELLILYDMAHVLVTNDSGPAHFAALMHIDVVTLFGPETPRLFAAPTARNHVIWAGIACSPCVNAFNDRQSRCSNNVCMQRITVDHVFDTVREIYIRRTTEA